MNNLIPTRVNPDYYYHEKHINDDIIFSKEEEDLQNNEKKVIESKKKFIVLSSLDRDWYNNSTSINPFNYVAKIGNYLNDTGNNDLFTMNTIKNIKSIEIVKMILPNKKIIIDYSNKERAISFEPYILVSLNQNNSTNDGTSDIINKASGVMCVITPISKAFSEVNYLEYKNINGAFKNYYNNPISNLSQLEVEIKTQLNQNPFPISDVLDISTIYSSGSNLNEILNIKSSTYFDDQYQIGDIIKIKNYVYRDIDTFPNESTSFNNFINRESGHKVIDIKNSNFAYFTITQSGTTITQSGGGNTDLNDRNFAGSDASKIIVYEDGTRGIVASHTNNTVIESNLSKTINSPQRIFLTSTSEVGHFNNTLVISIPHSVSTSDGTLSVDALWTNLKGKSDTEDDSSASGDSGGKLINTYLQSYLFINVNYLEYENVVSSQVI